MNKILNKYLNSSLIYAVLALVGGVFYREFTKFNDFAGDTMLSVVHTHYFVLGMILFLLLLLLEKTFAFSTEKTGKIVLAYNVGLNLTVIMFIVRGVLQVLETSLSKGLTAAISGFAGIGHIILGVSIILLILQIKKSVGEGNKNAN